MNKVFSTPFFGRWILFAIGLSLAFGLLASEAYRALAEYSFRADFAARVQREAASFHNRTVVGRGMGMVALAGMVDPTIRDAALETDIERAKSQRTHHEALRVLAAAAGAEHGFVVNRAGRITADWDYKNISPIGQDVSMRPYFKNAMAGIESIFGALSISTGRRTFYVAAPVRATADSSSPIIGAVAARYSATEIDEFLGAIPRTIGLFVSPTGVVFASSRAEWILWAASDLDADALAAMRAAKQFRIAADAAALGSSH